MKELLTKKFITKSGLIGIVRHLSFDSPELEAIKKISSSINTDWFCGYVIVPSNHPHFGKNYQELDDLISNIHGGLTYSGEPKDFGLTFDGTIFGFDCNHYCDTPKIQNLEYTVNEIENLAEQLAKISTQEVQA